MIYVILKYYFKRFEIWIWLIKYLYVILEINFMCRGDGGGLRINIYELICWSKKYDINVIIVFYNII